MSHAPDPQQLAQTAADPMRPRYHICAPAGWMNDPNGLVFYRGYYHVFYQWNPTGDTWGNIHWGHVRSRDLLTWEHLPAALQPSPELGETHCFSGCLALREGAPPLIVYTAIGPDMTARASAQQWAAEGDDDLLIWRKLPQNPILSLAAHDGLQVWDWRDPFIFSEAGRTFMLLGGQSPAPEGNKPAVMLYEAEDGALTRWTFRGILCRPPAPDGYALECPAFFKSGERWVLIGSPFGPVEYYAGDFDPQQGRLAVTTTGLMDGSDQFYAANLLRDPSGRVLAFGWVRGFPEGRGWNGCLSLPRVLSLDADGRLHQAPAPELAKLRGPGVSAGDILLGVYSPESLVGNTSEVRAVIERGAGGACELRLRRAGGDAQAVTLVCDAGTARLNDNAIDLPVDTGAALDIRLFLDRAVVEVFVNGRACLTTVLSSTSPSYRLEIAAHGGPARLRRLDVWPMTG